jgi:hypothetical protein
VESIFKEQTFGFYLITSQVPYPLILSVSKQSMKKLANF